MSNVVTLSFGRTYTDGGKARIRRHRGIVSLETNVALSGVKPSLVILDEQHTYIAPDSDCA
jgi:hypothetical protein